MDIGSVDDEYTPMRTVTIPTMDSILDKVAASGNFTALEGTRLLDFEGAAPSQLLDGLSDDLKQGSQKDRTSQADDLSS